jgi:P-type Ca2+ transporter type 2C
MILLLLGVGVIYSVWGELRDALTIFTVIILLVLSEIFTEYRAKKAVDSLRKLAPPVASLIRAGYYTEQKTTDSVGGDILVLKVGSIVPADARLLESVDLEVNESALTGESTSVTKQEGILAGKTSLADRTNMVFADTTIVRGRATAVVTATGMDTELGKITGLVLEAKQPKTPLQLAMKRLAGLLVWVAVSFSVIIPVIGLLQGKPLKDMVLTGLSLSFATIPEELPIVVTMVLGLGALSLSKRHVLIRRLKSAETLGSVTVIVTDKTGTLTENRMALSKVVTRFNAHIPSAENTSRDSQFLLRAGLLTSNVEMDSRKEYVGDPMEIALVKAAEKAGIFTVDVQKEYRLQDAFSFDSQRKMTSSVYISGGNSFVFAKGAPESILDKCTAIGSENERGSMSDTARTAIRVEVESMAGEAMRVIAFAYKKVSGQKNLTREEAESDLVFLGLGGFADPPRAGVREAVKTISVAGIKALVVSGDHPLTVEKIAADVGLDGLQKAETGRQLEALNAEDFARTVREGVLFARTTAEQKQQIVSVLQKQGEVVAVTGDGINDAPALKSADIGIAMGETGTEIARQTADMVLTDDSFISIAEGIREGRKIFDNLKKGITYYLCVKIALILCFIVPLILNLPFPFAPIQIIVLELFMDLAASATFVSEPIEKNVMLRLPYNIKARFINSKMIRSFAVNGACLSAAVLFNYLLATYSGWSVVQAQTIAFATWLIGHIFLALNMRSESLPLYRIGLFSNKPMLIWIGAVVIFLVLVTNLPQTQLSLKLTSLDLNSWLLAVFVPFVTTFWMEIGKIIRKRD